MATHHLGHHASVVGITGRAQPIHSVRRDVDGGVEPKRVIRSREVIIDRLGNSDDFHSRLGKTICGRQRTFATDDKKCVHSRFGHYRVDAVDSAVAFKRVCP